MSSWEVTVLSSSGALRQRGGPQPCPLCLAHRCLVKVCGIKTFFFFLSTKYMWGVVLVGVSNSQKPEFMVRSRICEEVLPE